MNVNTLFSGVPQRNTDAYVKCVEEKIVALYYSVRVALTTRRLSRL